MADGGADSARIGQVGGRGGDRAEWRDQSAGEDGKLGLGVIDQLAERRGAQLAPAKLLLVLAEAQFLPESRGPGGGRPGGDAERCSRRGRRTGRGGQGRDLGLDHGLGGESGPPGGDQQGLAHLHGILSSNNGSRPAAAPPLRAAAGPSRAGDWTSNHSGAVPRLRRPRPRLPLLSAVLTGPVLRNGAVLRDKRSFP